MLALDKQFKKPTSFLLVFREKLETDQLLQLHTNDANETVNVHSAKRYSHEYLNQFEQIHQKLPVHYRKTQP